jgi:hypothetical protein
LPLVSNFASEYAIKNVQEYQEGLLLNELSELLVFVDNNLFGININTIKTNTEAVLVANKEVGPDVKAGKSKDDHQTDQIRINGLQNM